MIKRLLAYTSITLFLLLGHTAFAATGQFFNVTASGAPAAVSLTLCLNGNGPLSCQRYNVTASNLSITNLIPNHNYPNIGIFINTPGYTVANLGIDCNVISNGYCLFATNGSTPKTITLSSSTNPLATHMLGGTVSGLTGTVVLVNDGGDPNTITTNGSFTFSLPVAETSSYNVTVSTQPLGQTCVVTNGSGTMGSSNVTNVGVTCASNMTTLTTSLTNLALGVSGQTRVITITNTGSNTAENFTINYPTWPAGTSATSNCGTSLNAGDSCNIIVIPGATPTSNCNTGTGSVPTPGVITVNASNVASPVTIDATILAHGCIYQQGYLFAIDDATAPNTSIGGTVASLSDNSAGITWDNGSLVLTSASSLTDGVTNTASIISTQGVGNYAATTCTNYTIDSSGNSPCTTGTCYTNWYLPAICQIGASGQGANCVGGTDNMETNLPGLLSGCVGAPCLTNAYWSSTEFSAVPSDFAWFENFFGGSSQGGLMKTNSQKVRCARNF